MYNSSFLTINNLENEVDDDDEVKVNAAVYITQPASSLTIHDDDDYGDDDVVGDGDDEGKVYDDSDDDVCVYNTT